MMLHKVEEKKLEINENSLSYLKTMVLTPLRFHVHWEIYVYNN